MKDYKVYGNVKKKIRVESDLGVLFLAEPLKYNTNVHSILMARRPPKKGNKASVTGWFDINNNFPENLHRYETKLIAASNNGISINISGSININGGPLVVNNRLVGVVSANSSHSLAKSANLAHYLPWIRRVIIDYYFDNNCLLLYE